MCFLAVDSTVSVTKKLKETHEAVSNSTINGDSEQYYQDIAFAELDMLIGKLKGTTKYKALNTIDSLTNTEKKILERVINIVETLDIDNSDAVIEAILNNFSALLAPGAHSQFGSGKNTQFEPEQRANPFENVFSKTAVFPPPAIAETDL